MQHSSRKLTDLGEAAKDDSIAMKEMSEAARQDTRIMKRLTHIALLYLPATLIAVSST
jgi:hypothetical protein